MPRVVKQLRQCLPHLALRELGALLLVCKAWFEAATEVTQLIVIGNADISASTQWHLPSHLHIIGVTSNTASYMLKWAARHTRSLESLTVCRVRLATWSVEPPVFEKLQSLTLRGCRLGPTLSIALRCMVSATLRVLDLADNRLTDLDSSLHGMQRLERLNLGRNLLTSLDGLRGLSSLRELFVNSNCITDSSESFSCLRGMDLHCLDLCACGSNNQLPPSFSSIFANTLGIHLQRLDLRFCGLSDKCIPAELGRLHNLQVLHLAVNQLKIFPSAVCELTQLQLLNLADNAITEINDGLCKLQLLEQLLLRFNRVASLECLRPLINSTTCLRVLDIRGNGSDLVIPDWLARAATFCSEIRCCSSSSSSSSSSSNSGGVLRLFCDFSGAGVHEVNGLSAKVQQIPASGEQPPLEAQLCPLTTTQFRLRLRELFGVECEPLLSDRPEYLKALCEQYRTHPHMRRLRRMQGEALPKTLTSALLEALNVLEFPAHPDRRGVQSQGYLTLIRPRYPPSSKHRKAVRAWKRLDKYRKLWDLIVKTVTMVDPSFAFTGVAVTKNFVSSAHRDKHDINCQYCLSLGDHAIGTGELCVEASPTEVVCIDTHDKIACVDGRYVHWVTGYEGTRYSLIWYQTEGQGVPRAKAVRDVGM